MVSLRIDGALLLPMDGPREAPLGDVRPASLRIRGNRIAALGALTPEPGEAVLDASHLVALPGFVQTHVHFCQTLLRGLADDLPLLEWLRTRIWPLEAAHLQSPTRARSLAEMLRARRRSSTWARHTTTPSAASPSGMRAFSGKAMMDTSVGVPRGLRRRRNRASRRATAARAGTAED